MIGSLRGRCLAQFGRSEVLLEVGGVGYRLQVDPRLAADLMAGPQEAFVWVHTYVREDALILHGFGTADERRVFEILIGAHGVGPSLAMAILGVHSPVSLARAVVRDDVDALTTVPGVGRKTAARLLIDLKAPLGEMDAPVGGPWEGLAAGEAEPSARPSTHEDVHAALCELGYGPEEATEALKAVPDEGEVDQLLKIALKELVGTSR